MISIPIVSPLFSEKFDPDKSGYGNNGYEPEYLPGHLCHELQNQQYQQYADYNECSFHLTSIFFAKIQL